MIWIWALGLSTGCVTFFTLVSGHRYINSVWTFGPIYWILRDSGTKKDKPLSIGFMRQTSHPWRTGKGVQVRVSKYVYQIGLSRKAQKDIVDDEHSGLLYALKGHQLKTPVKEIRKWK